MSRLTCLVLIMLLLVSVASATDVSGKWSGSMELANGDGQVQTVSSHAEFKQENHALTGTIGRDSQFPIAKGTIEGDKIQFEVTAPENGEDRLYWVTLTAVNHSQLQGVAQFEQGGKKVSAKLSLAREK